MATTAHAVADRDTPAGVLGAVRDSREAARRAEVATMVAALAWAEMHSVDSLDQASTVPGTDRGLAIAGEGAPLVAEFAVVELATALGRSADSAKLWLGTVLEVRYRLPQTWRRLVEGPLEPWRARQIAAHTMLLCREAAGWVDAQVAPVAERIGPVQLERVIAEAVRRYDPERAYADEVAAAERRHVTVHDRHVVGGCVEVSATLDAVDARDLDLAVGQAARGLLVAGSTASVDVRRAMALGEIARHELTLDLSTALSSDLSSDLGADSSAAGLGVGTRASGGQGTASAGRGAAGRDVTVYVHLDAAVLDLLEDETGADQPVGVVEKIGAARDITLGIDRLRGWLTRPGTAVASVSIRPVIDLNTTITSRGYQPSAALREQVVLRNRVCVFPHCTRAARAADLDHIDPYALDEGDGGSTSSENLAPLCRLHHRVKTHGGWSYTPLAPGEFLWHSPHGEAFLVDPTGTTGLPRRHRPPDDPPRHTPRP